MANFILGTRGSLLAVTQSTIIANTLKKYYPQHEFTLKIIKTLGDTITNKPLWQLEGKDFFTRELDDALIKKEVDFVVHSYKDLSIDRPEKICLAAIGMRKFAHDVLLVTKETLHNIQTKQLKTITIGTSSPRRQYLLQKHVQKVLPFGEELTIQFENLRGNINTRIEKLQSKEYDLICLAVAGLERLATLDESYEQLSAILQHIEMKFLPLSLFPAAPAQGALAIECLEGNHDLKCLLKKLHCQKTASEVEKEKNIFKKYGGGCHLALGVNVFAIHDEAYFINAAGIVDNHSISLQKTQPSFEKISLPKNGKIFLGLQPERIKELNLNNYFLGDEAKNITPLLCPSPHAKVDANYFVTSEHCLKSFNLHVSYNSSPFIWASGASLHQKLSQLGYWVHGDNDSRGSKILDILIQSRLKNFFLKNNPLVELTFEDTLHNNSNSWETYQSFYQFDTISEYFKEEFSKSYIFFWTSFRQFDFYSKNFPHILKNDCKHFCGHGKTLRQFQKHSLNFITPMPNINFFIHSILNQNQ